MKILAIAAAALLVFAAAPAMAQTYTNSYGTTTGNYGGSSVNSTYDGGHSSGNTAGYSGSNDSYGHTGVAGTWNDYNTWNDYQSR